MIFDRFFKKGQLCFWISLLIGFQSCTVSQRAKNENYSFSDWEMDILLDKGFQLEALDGIGDVMDIGQEEGVAVLHHVMEQDPSKLWTMSGGDGTEEATNFFRYTNLDNN